MTVEQLERWRAADIKTVPREELVDSRSVCVNACSGLEERVQSYLSQIKNPYCFLCGEIPVKISFSGDEHTLHERLRKYLLFRKGDCGGRGAEDLCREQDEAPDAP